MLPQKGINQQIEYYWWKEFLHRLRLVFYPIYKFTRVLLHPRWWSKSIPSMKSHERIDFGGSQCGNSFNPKVTTSVLSMALTPLLAAASDVLARRQGTKRGAHTMCLGNFTWRLQSWIMLPCCISLFVWISLWNKNMFLKHPRGNFRGLFFWDLDEVKTGLKSKQDIGLCVINSWTSAKLLSFAAQLNQTTDVL